MKNRPVNLNLFSIRFPFTALVSIVHRVTGFLLYLSLPILLWLFSQSLVSEQGFLQAKQSMQGFGYYCMLLVLAAFVYHLIAGVRHILMDFHIGVGLKPAKWGAILVVVLTLFTLACMFII